MDIDAPKVIEQFNSLRNELLSVLEDWYYLLHVKKQEIDFQYENIFGNIEDEIEEKSKNAAKLQRKVELICSTMKTGERISKTILENINDTINYELKNGGIQSFYTNSPVIYIEENQSRTKNTDDKADFAKVYRNIVKTLHPDIVGENEKNKKYWILVQSAYREKDAQKLNLFRKTLCPDYVVECINNDKIYKELIDLKNNIIREKQNLEDIKLQEPFNFENKLDDRNWLWGRKQLLLGRLNNLDRKIQYNRKIIQRLTSHIA